MERRTLADRSRATMSVPILLHTIRITLFAPHSFALRLGSWKLFVMDLTAVAVSDNVGVREAKGADGVKLGKGVGVSIENSH